MRTALLLTLLLALACSAPACAAERQTVVTSPDGNVVITLTSRNDGPAAGLFYNVSYKGKPVVLDSQLALDFKDAPPLAGPFTVKSVERAALNTQWRPVCGERSVVPEHYLEATVDLAETAPPHRLLTITLRAYNEGAALRYTLPKQPGLETVTIAAERTRFAFAPGACGYFTPTAQGTYARLPLPENKKPAERPLTVELANGLVAAVAEAALVDYARMRLAQAPDEPNTLVSTLAGPVTSALPLSTPWRVIMVGEKPGDLLERNYLLMNLNPPCAIEDTSWIRPGKVIREVTLSTAGGMACVDFAAAHGIEYVEFDAGWYGHEYDPQADARRVSVDPKRNPRNDLDLQAVIDYGRKKGVGIILYVNHLALERQIDEVLPLYEKWGVRGVKYGFVNVGSQQWTAWLHEAVRKAARHHLMVDVHDEYRPTGFSRTYPNLMTQEGIGGNETMPTATHNATLPFTRFLCGAGDYTICYYSNRIKTTHAHQLALATIYFSPWQFVFWYDKPADYRGEPEIEFFDRLPTVWNDTRVVQGEIGKFITTARRSGGDWFVGTITGDDARRLDVPLAFLDAGKKYVAHIYEDAEPDGRSRTNVRISRAVVDRSTIIRADLRPSGGQAIRLVPATAGDLAALKPYTQP